MTSADQSEFDATEARSGKAEGSMRFATQLLISHRRIGLSTATLLPPSAHGWEVYSALLLLRPSGGWQANIDDRTLDRIIAGLGKQ
jgi:hypothetical protein